MKMKVNIKKIITSTCAVMMILCSAYPVYASETLKLDVESAVSYGLEHSTAIKMMDNKISLAVIAVGNTDDNIDDLEDAEEKLDDAISLLKSNDNELKKAQEDLNAAKAYLAKGIAPVPVPLNDSVVIPAGSKIYDMIYGILIKLMPESKAEPEAKAKTAAITAEIASELESKQDKIDENKIAFQEANTTLEVNKARFEMKLEDTTEKIEDKIGYSTVITMSVEDAGELMTKMADINLDITRYAKDIYKNQIAMLIKKNYYDALYANKVMEFKSVAKERGQKQYELAKLSYENGMKAKDDLLLSKMYYDSTIIDYNLSEATYKNALLELKKNINLDINKEISLVDSMKYKVTEESLNKGLESGLKNRIEIRKVLGQRMIYDLNEEIIDDMYKNGNANTEATLLFDGAEIELEEKKNTIGTEICQSYELMQATGKMLNASNELIENAKEVVKIAHLKYEQGFGSSNALLKDLNLVENSGTIVEVIAAEEKLADIESKVANIQYSYTMAKVKFYNDSAILTY